MADLEKTVSIIFSGDDRIGKTIAGISGSIDSLGSRISTATQPLADLASSAVQLEAALAAMVAGGLALAIKQSGDFGDSFAEISTLIDDSSGNIQNFKNDILEYAQSSKTSISDINAAVYSAISAGVDYKDALAVLDQAEKLSIAGKADLKSTLLLLVGTLNAYGDSTDQASRYADSFFKTVKLGQTTLPELASSMSQVSTIAAQLGIPIDTVNAAIAALTKSGVPTSQAITQISGALSAFLKPSSQAQDISKQLGIEFSTAAVKSKGFETVLWEVYNATGGNEEIMAKLFGRVEGLRAALLLGADNAGFFKAALEEIRKAAGATDTAYQKMADNFKLVNQNLVNNLQVTLTKIGQPLLDEYGDIAESLINIFQGVSIGIDKGAFNPVFETLEGFSTNAVNFLNAVAQSMPEALENLDFSKFINSIKGLGKEVQDLFNAFFGDVDLTTPEGLAAAIQKIVDSGTTLTSIVKEILNVWEPFIKAIGDGIDKFNKSGDEVKDLVGELLGWSQIINKITSNIGLLTGAIGSVGIGINLLAVTRIPALISAFGSLGASVGLVTVPLIALAGLFAALTPNTGLGSFLRENSTAFRNFAETIDDVVLKLGGYDVKTLKASETQAKQTKALGDAAVAMVKFKEKIGDIPSEKTTDFLIEGTEEYQDEFDKILTQIKSVPAEKTTKVLAEADKASLKKAKEIVLEELPDGTTILIQTKVNQSSLDSIESKINTLPSEKILEIRAKGEVDTEIERIKAQAETIQNAFEWSAKLNIAEVEANAEIVTSLAEGWASAFESTGEVITGALGALSNVSSASELLQISRLIETESVRRNKILENETKLTDAQVKYMKARTEAMQKGQGLITINAEGLVPELTLVLHKIIELTQIRANEEGLELLIGV